VVALISNACHYGSTRAVRFVVTDFNLVVSGFLCRMQLIAELNTQAVTANACSAGQLQWMMGI
jgi:hypothetical protein